jgi:hypothetical protein
MAAGNHGIAQAAGSDQLSGNVSVHVLPVKNVIPPPDTVPPRETITAAAVTRCHHRDTAAREATTGHDRTNG